LILEVRLKISIQKSTFKNLTLYPQLYATKLVVIYKVTFRQGEWEGQQQDASQETCHLH
jgi:hypothetical protein